MGDLTATVVIEARSLIREALVSLMESHSYKVICSLGSPADIDCTALKDEQPKLVMLAGTPEGLLVSGRRRRTKANGVTDEQLSVMRRESVTLDRQFRLIEESSGLDHLDLVLAKGYLGRLLANEHIQQYLQRHHKDILTELRQLTEQQTTAV